MRLILQLLATGLILVAAGDALRSAFNLNAEIGYTPKVIVFIALWWGSILSIAISFVIWRKRNRR